MVRISTCDVVNWLRLDVTFAAEWVLNVKRLTTRKVSWYEKASGNVSESVDPG